MIALWDQARCIVMLASVVLAHALLAGCADQPAAPQADRIKLDNLLTLMKARLENAAQAAREAWLSKRVIDPSRAQADDVDSAVNHAVQYSLPPEMVRDFFLAQIEAAKHVQSMLYSRWQAEPASRPKGPSANPDSPRARIEPLNTPLLAALAAAYPILRREGGRRLLQERSNALLTGIPGGTQAVALAVAPLWDLTN